MGGCAAFNCRNHSRKGYRMFRFPSDPERRRRWIINCRRSNWEPGLSAQICIVHFEESQFQEQGACVKKLKRNAIPTLFNVPNPPPTLIDKRQKGIGRPKPDTILAQKMCEKVHFEESQLAEQGEGLKKLKRNAIPTFSDVPNPPPTLTDKQQIGIGYPKPDTILAQKCEKENSASNIDLLKRIEALEKENEMLKRKVKESNDKFSSLSSFLCDEQINYFLLISNT